MKEVSIKVKAVRIIKAGDIKQHYSIRKAIDAMEWAFVSFSSGESYVPLRYVSDFPSNDLLMLFKPAYVAKDKRIAVKVLTQRENGRIQGIPAIQGIVLLIDADTGEILSLMDGAYLTALRTGAASGLATRCFARKDSRVMALFGCGAQGRTQVEAVVCEREIKEVLVYEKRKEAADNFISEIQAKLEIEMVYTSDIKDLRACDIICTATNAKAPLFRKEDVKPGVHINAIGSFRPDMQELDPALIREARVFADSAESCLKESGDLVRPIREGIIDDTHLAGEIGEYCMNKVEGRSSENEITVFKSVGVASQDYAVARDIYSNALKENFGQEIRLFE